MSASLNSLFSVAHRVRVASAEDNTHALLRSRTVCTAQESGHRRGTTGLGGDSHRTPKNALRISNGLVFDQHRALHVPLRQREHELPHPARCQRIGRDSSSDLHGIRQCHYLLSARSRLICPCLAASVPQSGGAGGTQLGAQSQSECNNIKFGVRWVMSYANAVKTKTYCIYEAPSKGAIRKAAAANALPVDSITEAPVTLLPK